MKDIDSPIIDMPILRRDLYLVMSLLLADKRVAETSGVENWTTTFYETEVRRLMVWVTVAVRGLLDLPQQKDIPEQTCGEYWPDIRDDKNQEKLTLRQACNSVIHAKEILLYKVPRQRPKRVVKRIYNGRATVRGNYKDKTTRAQIDIVGFVKIANVLINSFEEKTMPTDRDTYKYHFKMGNKIVYAGITNDIDRREVEHQREKGWDKGHIKQVGQRTRYDVAREWEAGEKRRRIPTSKE